MEKKIILSVCAALQRSVELLPTAWRSGVPEVWMAGVTAGGIHRATPTLAITLLFADIVSPRPFLSRSPGGEHVAAVALGDNGQFLSISAMKLFWRQWQWQTNTKEGGRRAGGYAWNKMEAECLWEFFFFLLPQTSAVKYFGRIDPRTHTVCVTVAVLIFPRGHQ